MAVIGFVYPVFASFKAINNARDPEPVVYWLKFWVVWMTFFILETFGDAILSWIPLYYGMKLTFLIWCFLPKYRGANVMYNVFVQRLLLRHEATIDSTLVLQQIHSHASLVCTAHVCMCVFVHDSFE